MQSLNGGSHAIQLGTKFHCTNGKKRGLRTLDLTFGQ